MPRTFYKKIFLLLVGTVFMTAAKAQDSAFESKHAAIFFPYPMYKEKWRSSIGFTLMTTPEDVTEETRIRIPCGDYHLLRRISNHWMIDARLAFQIIQNHLSVGFRYVHPISSKFYYSVGSDLGFWFGIVKVSGFNSRAFGLINYPNASIGFKTNNNLLITLKGQVSFNLMYQARNGENTYTSKSSFYNGESFTLALEQPFFNQKHVTLGFSAINNYFFWQTWALFYKTNRKVFYPQITLGLIL